MRPLGNFFMVDSTTEYIVFSVSVPGLVAWMDPAQQASSLAIAVINLAVGWLKFRFRARINEFLRPTLGAASFPSWTTVLYPHLLSIPSTLTQLLAWSQMHARHGVRHRLRHVCGRSGFELNFFDSTVSAHAFHSQSMSAEA